MSSTQERVDFEIKVRLNVTDFACDANVITNLLGITPDRTWKAGETVAAYATNVHKENGWSIDSPVSSISNTLDDQINTLEKTLLGKTGKFRELPEGTEVELLCVVYAYKYFPDLYFSPANVAFLHEINASIDIDIYDMGV